MWVCNLGTDDTFCQQGDLVAAEEWQLCWECPGEAPHCQAAFVLQHVYVNPQAGKFCDACKLLLHAEAP